MSLAPSKKLFKQYDKTGTEDLEDWRARFVEVADPTEYLGAIELMGSWRDWQTFKRNWPTFTNNILPDWVAEIEVKLRAEAIRDLCNQAATAKGTAAAKWIAEGKYRARKAGAPSKAEVQREAKIQARIDNEVEDDIARVQGVVH